MSISQGLPTTTSSVDVSGFEQMLEDHSIPCESRHWHNTGDEPAVWAVWFANPCTCPVVMRFHCDSCLQKKQTSTLMHTCCARCNAHFPGPTRRYIVRTERIK